MSEMDFLKKSFEEAVKFESYGRQFFIDAAKEAQNPFAREVFNNLADEELKHIQRINEVFKSLKEEGTWPDKTPESGNLPWRHIFRDALDKFKDTVKPGMSDKESLDLGLNFERKGYKFYDEMVKQSSVPGQKRFFVFLRDEEEGHYLIIEHLKKYLENPTDWYGEQERHIFEG